MGLTPRRCTLPRLPTLPPAVPSTMPSVPTPTLPATLTPTTMASSPPTLALLDSSPTPTALLSQSSPLMWSPPVVYFDISIGGKNAGRVEMTLRYDVTPVTAE